MGTNIEKEEMYLAKVLHILETKIMQMEEKMVDNQKDIESMHDYFWENYTEFDEYGYEMYDNKQALKTRENQQESYGKEHIRLKRMQQSPYFGRVDFCYEGEDEAEKFYIGVGNLSEGRASDSCVYDWRAPISSLFYDYDKGEAEFVAPAGIIHGEITRKKQYKIKHGKLVYVLENEMNIDDEVLQMALSEHADAKLKSIVTTIQKEQNRIIRDTTHPILAVQGCAGSGKTSIALHRIAYLLYHSREQLEASQILILSPNSIFADYISRILPELGEENICEMTLDDFAYRELRRYGEAENRYDEIEKMLHADETEEYFISHQLKMRTSEADYKQTREYVKELDGFILNLESEIMNFKDFHFKKMEMPEENIVTFFYEKLCDVPIFSRMNKIGEYLIDAEETLRGKNMEEDERQIVFDKLNRMYDTKNLLSLYNRFLKETGRETLDTQDGCIAYEDVYPLLYLKFATIEPPEKRKVKHLVIDEMQDYSYLQYLVLDLMFDCPMTILGDKVQTMAEAQQDVLKFLPKIFGKTLHQVFLNKSYRSTSEITEFANAIIGDDNTEGIGRHGEMPQLQKVPSKTAMYRKMAEEIGKMQDLDTIAILCMDAESAGQVTEEMKAYLEVELLTVDSMRFKNGVSVMPFYLAKGLEFDAVLVPETDRYHTPLQKQALYIEATRALHILKLFACEADTVKR